MVAAAAPPASRYPIQRTRLEPAARFQLGQRPAGRSPATAATAAPAPAPTPRTPQRRRTFQEQRRQGQDYDQAGHDERDTADQGAEAAADPVGAEDRQLSGGGSGQQVAGGDGVLELLPIQPALAVHAELAQ